MSEDGMISEQGCQPEFARVFDFSGVANLQTSTRGLLEAINNSRLFRSFDDGVSFLADNAETAGDSSPELPV